MRFHKEAEAGMRLRHPNIVQIIDQGQQDNRHYHDHGIRRGDEPARVPAAAHPAASDQRGPAAHARPGPRPAILSRPGSDPPRPQGDEHPDLQLGHGQAGRFRSGDDRGRRLAARRSPASGRSITRPSSGPAAAPRETLGPTSISWAASSTTCSPARFRWRIPRARTRSRRCSSAASASSSRSASITMPRPSRWRRSSRR